MDVPIKNYSSGMHMRLGFAIAANLNPNIMLLDEIFAVGDEEFQRQCMATLEEFLASGRRSCSCRIRPQRSRPSAAGCACSIGATLRYDGAVDEGLAEYRRLNSQSPHQALGGSSESAPQVDAMRRGIGIVERRSLGGRRRLGLRFPPPSGAGAVEIRPRRRLRQPGRGHPPAAVHGAAATTGDSRRTSSSSSPA